MTLLLLLRTNHYGTPYASHWSDHFPRKSQGHSSHWNFHFPDTPSTDTPGTSPQGVATFVLESQAKVTFAWRTGVFKSYSGKERRSGLIDDPAMRFEGQALLVGDRLRGVRSKIAQYAAKGRPFQLGLPYEELTLSATSAATVVNVHSTAKADWCVPGQRVVVRRFDGSQYQYVEAVIQSSTSNTITIDETLGDVGSLGASIMPTIAVFLEPQQGFQRYVTPDGVEHWNIRARAAVAGFASSAVRASLSLASVTVSGFLDGVVIQALEPGTAGNSIDVQQSDTAVISGGEIDEDIGTQAVHIRYMPGVTTVAQYMTLLQQLTFTRALGTPSGDDTDILGASDNEFASTALTGGQAATPCTWGLTATLTTFLDAPVWDRGVAVEGSADDSVHTMAEVQDLGGLPFAAGSANVPDWGRRVSLSRALLGEWQWAKKFLDTVKGRWKSFWLPTYRPDLVATAKAAGTLTVESGESDVTAWYPLQRTTLAVRYTSGTWVYLQITDAVDNLDGTVTLDVADEDGVSVTLASVPELVCWLERVRLESDEAQVEFGDARFSLSMLGRAVQQDDEGALSGLAGYEESVESSAPREGIEWILPAITQYDATGTRAVEINGHTFSPLAIGREGLAISTVGDEQETIVQVPTTHYVATRYLAGGLPPKQIFVNIWRKQAGGEETVWRGIVTSVAPAGHVLRFKIASRIGVTIQRRLPTITAGRNCPHILYDDNCRVDRDALTASGTTTVASVNGRKVTVALSLPTNNAFQFGELVHSSSGERMTIQEQIGSLITIQLPIYGLAVGDAVIIYPGCNHTITVCDETYSNRDNFGGFPQLPTTNPCRANQPGFSVVEQE